MSFRVYCVFRYNGLIGLPIKALEQKWLSTTTTPPSPLESPVFIAKPISPQDMHAQLLRGMRREYLDQVKDLKLTQAALKQSQQKAARAALVAFEADKKKFKSARKQEMQGSIGIQDGPAAPTPAAAPTPSLEATLEPRDQTRPIDPHQRDILLDLFHHATPSFITYRNLEEKLNELMEQEVGLMVNA